MMYRADGVMVQCLKNRRNPQGLKAQNPVEAEGLVFVERCDNCGGKDKVSDAMYEDKSPSGVLCNFCRAPWETQKAYRFIGEVRVAPKKSAGHDKLGRMLDLSMHFDRLIADESIQWPIRYYVANCDGWSLRALVEEGPKTWGPDAPDTVYGVRLLVREGREIWSATCRKIGVKV
ncbi:MAG TPA: hypothetical protein EYF98_05040 [Planctomycetes bacterium]|nr:hypothetical protein [Planctomycetota bacterium]